MKSLAQIFLYFNADCLLILIKIFSLFLLLNHQGLLSNFKSFHLPVLMKQFYDFLLLRSSSLLHRNSIWKTQLIKYFQKIDIQFLISGIILKSCKIPPNILCKLKVGVRSWCWDNQIFTCKKIKLNSYLTI